MLTIRIKTNVNEHRMAWMHATASKLTFLRKNAIFMLINLQAAYEFKEQYSLRANLAYLAPPGHFFMGAKVFIRIP